MFDYKEMGKRMHDLRIDSGMRVAEFSEKMSISVDALKKYEAGSRRMPLWLLVEYSRYFNVTTDYILMGGAKKAACSEWGQFVPLPSENCDLD